jgi:periplasmic protein TonB
VVLTLLESRRERASKRLFSVGFVSVAIHTVIVAAIAYATMNAAGSDFRVRADTTVVLLAPDERPKAPQPDPIQLVDAMKGFQTVVVPAEIPIAIPPVDLRERFDPKDYSGAGVEGGHAGGIVPTGNEVYAEALVDEKPSLLSAPPPAYPPLLKQAGIGGRVLLRAIVDTTGRIEPASVRILQSPNPGFDQPTRDWLMKALFRPARMHGQAVRTFISLPVDYSIKTTG